MQTGTHILTAAHCVDSAGTSGTFGPDGASSARFDLVRDANNIDIRLSVPVANITVHPTWGGNNNISAGNDLAIFTLTDPNDPAPDRRLVAPCGAQRYPLFTGNVTGETFTVVGYGETGTGATGQQANEVQRAPTSRLPLSKVPANRTPWCESWPTMSISGGTTGWERAALHNPTLANARSMTKHPVLAKYADCVD